MVAYLFGICVALLVLGIIWFEIVRPMLQDFGVIHVNAFDDDEVTTSGSTIAAASSGTGAAPAVPSLQHQAAPELVPDFAGVLDYLKEHNLTDEQAIDLLTLARRESGDLLSANKIRDIVGGNEAEVKRRVASHRPKPAAPRSQGRMLRPEGGW